ncbi:MAG: YkoF family thiamine/hydroxymethylpyrimidine-binding protein [Pseudomonadales bacterium]
MKTSIDISLYPLKEDYIPAIKSFIEGINSDPNVAAVTNDLSTQLYGDYDAVMDLLKAEIKRSWETYGKGVFVVKFLSGDVRR